MVVYRVSSGRDMMEESAAGAGHYTDCENNVYKEIRKQALMTGATGAIRMNYESPTHDRCALEICYLIGNLEKHRPAHDGAKEGDPNEDSTNHYCIILLPLSPL